MLYKKKILITFARSFIALEIARHFHSAGYLVYVADSIDQHVSKYSNAVAKTFKLPSPRFDSLNYINSLIALIEKEKIDLVVPIYEETAYISKALDWFPKTCKIFTPSFDLYAELQNKWMFQQKLQSLGFDTLKHALIRKKEELKSLDFDFPFAIKPCYTRTSQKVKKIIPHQESPVDIEIDSFNPWIAQEWGVGNKFCTYSVCHQGKIYAHSVYPVNYAIGGNSCLIFKAVEHPSIFEWVSKFAAAVNFTGQIAFDLIENDDKKIFAIECNPRATSGLLLFREKDRLDRAFLGTNTHLIQPEMGKRKQIAMGMLLYGWRKNAKQNNRLTSFIKDFFSTKDVIFKLKDAKPFLLKPWFFANIWLKSRRLGLNIPNYFTHDHDWNGEPFDHLA